MKGVFQYQLKSFSLLDENYTKNFGVHLGYITIMYLLKIQFLLYHKDEFKWLRFSSYCPPLAVVWYLSSKGFKKKPKITIL